MEKRSLIIALVCLAGGVWFFFVSKDKKTDEHPEPSTAVAPTSSKPAATKPAATKPAAPMVRRMGKPEMRGALLARVRQLREQRTKSPWQTDLPAAAGGTPSGDSHSPAPNLQPEYTDYIRDAVRDLIPLFQECYQAGLEQSPDLAGRITVNFSIEGEEEVGGLIGWSEVDDERSSIADPEFRQCVQETMYAIEIDPPDGGGVVNVTYPFVFQTSE